MDGGERLTERPGASSPVPLGAAPPPLPSPPRSANQWDFDEELRSIERSLQRAEARLGSSAILRLDADPARLGIAPLTAPRPAPPAHSRPAQLLRAVVLSLRAAGFGVLACGAVLWAWSWLGERPDLWNPGLGFTVLGQLALLAAAALDRMAPPRA